MKKTLLFCLGLLVLSSCSRPAWHRTTEGTYIYCEAKDKYLLSWKGNTKGSLADGRGQLVSYKKDGEVKDNQIFETKLGVVRGGIKEWKYVSYGDYRYLGKLDDNVPNGFGVKIQRDTISIGTFKDSRLYKGLCEQYVLKGDKAVPLFSGMLKKGKVNGVVKYYADGQLVFEGNFKKGARNGIGKEYEQGVLVYAGNYKKNHKSGYGKAYANGNLVYDGEWKEDLYDGEGKLYNAQGMLVYDGEFENGLYDGKGKLYNESGFLVYDGNWSRGVYDGKGKLYENGVCTEGKWDEGQLTKSISTSTFEQIGHATKMWFHSDSVVSDSIEEVETIPMADNQIEFVEQLQSDIETQLQEEFSKRVDKRFGFWHLLRMWGQPWLRSDVKRARFAQEYFCKKVNAKEMQQFINAKIDFYNKNVSAEEKMNYIHLDEIPNGAIVDTDTALKVFDREALETTDTLVGIVVDILICCVLAFIIGFIIGFFFPPAIPYAFIIDIVMAIIAFGIGLYLSVFRTSAICIELESQITEMLVNNYMQFIDSQNIIMQMLGTL